MSHVKKVPKARERDKKKASEKSLAFFSMFDFLGSFPFLDIEVLHHHVLRDVDFLLLAVGAHEHCVMKQLFDD